MIKMVTLLTMAMDKCFEAFQLMMVCSNWEQGRTGAGGVQDSQGKEANATLATSEELCVQNKKTHLVFVKVNLRS